MEIKITLKQFISVTLILLTCLTAHASGMFTTVKTLTKNDTSKHAYVAAGYPYNTKPFKSELNLLWESSSEQSTNDEHGQPWKKVDISKLKKIIGHFPTEYYVIIPTIKNTSVNKVLVSSIESLSLTIRNVQHAALFKWGCDGAVTPVLSLGEWDEELKDWDTAPVAISRNSDWRYKRQEPTFGTIDITAIPPALVPKDQDSVVGFSINWKNEKLGASLLYHAIDNDYTLFSVGRGFSY